MIPVIKEAGVTSKDGFQQFIPERKEIIKKKNRYWSFLLLFKILINFANERSLFLRAYADEGRRDPKSLNLLRSCHRLHAHCTIKVEFWKVTFTVRFDETS